MYMTTEKELLIIVATLKEFIKILLGNKVTEYIDHKTTWKIPQRMAVIMYYIKGYLSNSKEHK